RDILRVSQPHIAAFRECRRFRRKGNGVVHRRGDEADERNRSGSAGTSHRRFRGKWTPCRVRSETGRDQAKVEEGILATDYTDFTVKAQTRVFDAPCP